MAAVEYNWIIHDVMAQGAHEQTALGLTQPAAEGVAALQTAEHFIDHMDCPL